MDWLPERIGSPRGGVDWAVEAVLVCIAAGVVVRLGATEEGKKLLVCPARVPNSVSPVVVIGGRGTDPWP